MPSDATTPERSEARPPEREQQPRREPRLDLDEAQVRELRLRILANVYSSPLIADAVARRILRAGDLGDL